MCGIITFSITKHFDNTERGRTLFGNIFKTLLVLNEERGYDAAGISVIKNPTAHSWYIKKQKRMFSLLNDRFDKDCGNMFNNTKHILCHSRAITSGPNIHYNTQPIIIKNKKTPEFYGVHNGTILNATEINGELKIDDDWSDSAIIFNKIYNTDKQDCVQILSKIKGSATLLWTDNTDDFNTLNIYKNDRPLSIWYWNGVIICSSDEDYLEKAFYLNKQNIEEYYIIGIPIINYIKTTIDISKTGKSIFGVPERCV
jgi:glucosamine 6-phosphate synthetase-like amidotransferase/phosphosugar isomerase protein